VQSSTIVRSEATEKKMFGEDCNIDDECVETQFCNKGTCDCPSQNSKWLEMYFSEDTRSCVNSVGKACTLEKDFMMDFLCGPNAVCTDTEDMTLPANFGVCKCKEGFRKDVKGQKCIPRTENVGSEESSSESNGNANELVIDSRARARQAITQVGDYGENDLEDDEDDYSEEVMSTDFPKGLSETDTNLKEDEDTTNSSGANSLDFKYHSRFWYCTAIFALIFYVDKYFVYLLQ